MAHTLYHLTAVILVVTVYTVSQSPPPPGISIPFCTLKVAQDAQLEHTPFLRTTC